MGVGILTSNIVGFLTSVNINFNEAIKYENVRLGCPFFFAYVFYLGSPRGIVLGLPTCRIPQGKQRKNEDRSIYTPHPDSRPPSQEWNLYHPIFFMCFCLS